MIGWTLCSGIGAPEVGCPEIDWRLASEVEAFPRAVLAKRFGHEDARKSRVDAAVPLLWGDLTTLRIRHARRFGADLPDVLVAGTPCQAFSVAGLRRGLADPRGNLTIAFVGLCHAIVAARGNGLVVVWENVPGVLSDDGNAFGAMLGALVGADDAIPVPGGGSWPSAGMVSGPRARAAWRVLDAQYFGVAQRRRRVFLVVDLGGSGVDPAAVLFEPQGVRRHPPARGEAGQGAAGGAGSGAAAGIPEVCGTLSDGAHNGGGLNGQDAYTGRILPVAFDTTQVTSAANRSNPKPGDACHPLAAGAHAPAIAFDLRGRDGGAMPEVQGDAASALRAASGGSSRSYVAFSCKDHGADATDGLSPTLRAMGHGASHENAGGQVAVAFAHQAGGKQTSLGYRDDGLVQTLGANQTPRSEGSAVRRLTPRECERLQGFPDDWTAVPFRGREIAADGPRYKALGNSWAVPCGAWVMRRVAAQMKAARAAA